jgi:uncharacterized protein (DUF983 family)
MAALNGFTRVSPGHDERIMSENKITAVSPYAAGLRGRCPRCGEGRLFDGFLELAPRCERCDLDYAFADAGDGPAVFVVLIAGFAVVGSAVLVEAAWRPPYWLHAVLWLPMLLILTLGLLRPLKGLLVALQYHHKAEEGRIDRDAPKDRE